MFLSTKEKKMKKSKMLVTGFTALVLSSATPTIAVSATNSINNNIQELNSVLQSIENLQKGVGIESNETKIVGDGNGFRLTLFKALE
jgi:hypothetical protein